MALDFKPASRTVTWNCQCGFSLTGTSLEVLDRHILRHRIGCLHKEYRNLDEWKLSEYDKLFLSANGIKVEEP